MIATNVGRAAVDAGKLPINEPARERTAKTCGPDAAVLASSWRVKFRRRRWQKEPFHRGELVISRKPFAQGMFGIASAALLCSLCALLVHIAHEDRGVQAAHPAFPLRPLNYRGRGSFPAKLRAKTRGRDREYHVLPVICEPPGSREWRAPMQAPRSNRSARAVNEAWIAFGRKKPPRQMTAQALRRLDPFRRTAPQALSANARGKEETEMTRFWWLRCRSVSP